MKTAISEKIKKGLDGLLPGIFAVVLLLAALALIPLIWPSGKVEAGVAIVAGDEDEHDDMNSAEGTWLKLPDAPPDGQEIILVNDRTSVEYGREEEGELVESISTGTNDFDIVVSYEAGKWKDVSKGVELTDAAGNSYASSAYYGNHREFLLSALNDRERELKMKIPPAVQKKMQEGYQVGVAASDVQNYVSGQNWQKLPDLPKMDKLFYLNKPLEYKFENGYLYIKCHPQIEIRNYYYEDIFPDFTVAGIPLVHERYGGNGHTMYKLNGEWLGSTSAIVWNTRLLNDELETDQQQELEKEVSRCNSADGKTGLTWIHFSQIRSSKGYLDGYTGSHEPPNGKPPFIFQYWQDGKGHDQSSAGARVGNGSFVNGTGIRLWFAFPLELTFYLMPTEDVAVLAIEFDELEPESMAEVTVRVLNLGTEDKENVPLTFTIPGITEQSENVDIPAGAPADPDDPDSSWEPGMAEIIFSFPVPEKGIMEMTAEINPEINGKRAFEEITYDNNTLTVTAIAGDYGDLAPWVYSREIVFSLPTASASLNKPGYAWWVGSATGTLYVHNDSQDLYRITEFKADDRPGNPSAISVIGSSGHVSHSALIRATLHREDFGDDPANLRKLPGGPYYADNGTLYRTGSISTSGSINQRYNYWYYCSNDKCRGHIGSGSGWGGAFNNVNYSKEYTAEVYNGREEIGPPIFDNSIYKPSSYKRRLCWTSHPYELKAIHLMYDQKEDGSLSPGQPPSTSDSDGIKAPGQYGRVFSNQNKAEIEWRIEPTYTTPPTHSMPNEYKKDREKAKNRNYSLDGSEKVAFASDLKYKDEPYPFRSGYYFNPAGTYSFTLKTEIYKDKPDRTPEHEKLVNSFIASFRYETNMTYITNDRYKEAVRINGDSVTKSGTTYPPGQAYVSVGNNLFNINIDNQTKTVYNNNQSMTSPGYLFDIDVEMDYDLNDVEELRHNYVEAGANAITDSRFKKILEGYAESDTQDSAANFKYVEFVRDGQHIYKISETTTVTITVNPSNKKVYTHVQMKNGEYYARVYMADVNVRVVTEKDEPEQTGVQYPRGLTVVKGNLPSRADSLDSSDEMLDEIKIDVVGSMYDDAR